MRDKPGQTHTSDRRETSFARALRARTALFADQTVPAISHSPAISRRAIEHFFTAENRPRDRPRLFFRDGP